MGWETSSDTLEEVILKFPTKEKAIEYAIKNKISYTIIEPNKKEFVIKVCGLLKERASFITDMLEDKFYFEAPSEYDEKTIKKKWKEDTPEVVQHLKVILENIAVFSEENIDEAFKKYLEDNDYGFGQVMPGFRLLVTGKGMGPSISAISAILGKDEVLSRIDKGLLALEKN